MDRTDFLSDIFVGKGAYPRQIRDMTHCRVRERTNGK